MSPSAGRGVDVPDAARGGTVTGIVVDVLAKKADRELADSRDFVGARRLARLGSVCGTSSALLECLQIGRAHV